MADKGAKGGAPGEEGKEGEDKEPEKGCCDKYAECLVVTGKVIIQIYHSRQYIHVVWQFVHAYENAQLSFGILVKKDAVLVQTIVINTTINGKMKVSQMCEIKNTL